MDVDGIQNLREWSPLSDLLSKIPTRIQKTFFYQDVNITCIDVLSDFIALGSDVGIVFWYNRSTGDVQKLRSEFTSPITCVKVVSSVEYMLACGSSNGQVSVFQIQKEHPPDLNLVTPMTKPKPVERYTIRDLHQSAIRSVEWSKNGMKLFSGDKSGVVVLTEFDFQMHISKSMEILNEAYDIVQISFNKPWLLISTVYRAIVCQCDKDGRWKVSQVGKQDRKILSEVGAAFMVRSRHTSLVCARPGYRFWLSDTDGNVSQTLLFKDSLPKFSFEIPVLNPAQIKCQLPSNFGRCYVYQASFVLTYSENILYILDIEKLKVLASLKRLRKIISISVCGSEIFILEGPRSVIRISNLPEPPNKMTSKFYFNTGLTPSNTFEPSPVEFEAEEETVLNAEECFELPPIEQLQLKTPITMSLSEHDLLSQDKMLLEHSKKAEIFEKIGQLEFDSILFKTGVKKKKPKDKTNKVIAEGIVEIGRPADSSENSTPKVADGATKVETNRPCVLDASFCEGIVTDLGSPKTMNKLLESKESKLAAALNIEPVSCEKIALRKPTTKLTPDLAPEFHYPLYPLMDPNELLTAHTTPQKKMFFLDNDEDRSSTTESKNCNNDEVKIEQNKRRSTSPVLGDDGTDIPDVKQVPDYMNIPNLWNVQLIQPDTEKQPDEKTHPESSGSSSEWELV
ncbi:hypothetical protein HA402_014491 [Bradysia odoriphaga]|nr:hypothetical protein HA402_014491 [Bradysia odoriphaga]